MKIIRLEINKISTINEQEIIRTFMSGGTIMFPSDTIYGLATDPKNGKAINHLYQIKQRDVEKRISCIYSNLDEVEKYCKLTQTQKDIINRHVPGAFTFIVNNTEKLVTPNSETLGIRIPDSKYTIWLSKVINSPYTSTSANISGLDDNYAVESFLEQTKNSEYLPDLILDAGQLPPTLPSTVVDLTTKIPNILRQGSGRFIF